MAIAIRRLDGRFRGHTIMERDDLAQNLVDVGSAEYVKDFPGHETAAAPAVETAENKPISSRLTRSQLQAIAEERGVEVAGTGRGGAVTKADLIAALS